MNVTIPYEQRIDNKTLNYIKENYGRIDSKKIAKKLKISEIALERITIYHGFSSMRVNQGVVSTNMIASAFGVDYRTVIKWSEKPKFNGNLPLMELPSSRKSQGINTCRGAEPEQVWKWVYQNLEHVDLRKYEPFSLLPEPEWLEDRLKFQRRTLPPLKTNRLWSQAEDNQLWFLFYTCGKTQKEIARIMGRPLAGIEHRMKRLRDKKLSQPNQELAN